MGNVDDTAADTTANVDAGVENSDANVSKDDVSADSGLTLDQALSELKKVRQEAASRRIELKDLKGKAAKWDEYEQSQKTEMEKLQERIASYEQEISAHKIGQIKQQVAREILGSVDDAELLSGNDEESLRAHAQRLKARLGGSGNSGSSPATDLMAGSRGKPVGADSTKSVDDFIRSLAGK